MYGITVAEAVPVVLRGNQMRPKDLTDLEELIEWTRIGTMIEYLGIHTCETLLVYLRHSKLVIASEEFGIARGGKIRRGMTPTMTILNIVRALPFLTLTGTAGTRTITTDPQGGTTKINGVRVDLGQTETDDLSSVIPALLLGHPTHGRLERNVKPGNYGNGMQGGDQRILRPRLAQTVGMPGEHL